MITDYKQLAIHCDASCYYVDGRMGLGIAFFKDNEEEPFYTQGINKHDKKGTSNEAEYLAVINALIRLSADYKAWEEITIYSDSEVIINQINGMYAIHKKNLKPLYNEVKKLVKGIPRRYIFFEWVPRTHPRQQIVDKISKMYNPYFIEKNEKGI